VVNSTNFEAPHSVIFSNTPLGMMYIFEPVSVLCGCIQERGYWPRSQCHCIVRDTDRTSALEDGAAFRNLPIYRSKKKDRRGETKVWGTDLDRTAPGRSGSSVFCLRGTKLPMDWSRAQGNSISTTFTVCVYKLQCY
jgi:hypothetical protein